jgi:nucleotide-binding universal stress UspA family protein
MGQITWFANPKAMVEGRFRSLGRSFWGTLSRGAVPSKPIRPNGSKRIGPAPVAHVGEHGEAHAAVIVVPVDFSPASLDAVQVGVSMARHARAKLVLCHAIIPKVIPFGPASPLWVTTALRDEALKQMEPALTLVNEAGLPAECVIEEGSPAQAILKVARRFDADLIILAPREHGPWARVFFGPSTADRVMRQAESHVMILRTRRD